MPISDASLGISSPLGDARRPPPRRRQCDALDIRGGEGGAECRFDLALCRLRRGRFTASVNGPKPAFTLTLSLTDFDAQSFFAAALATTALGGAALTADLAATGATQREIVASLGGAARLELTGGALGGVDLEALARSLAGTGAPEGIAADDGTTIQSLVATFSAQNGMATLGEESMLAGPNLAWSVRGTFGLAARALRLALAPAKGALFSMPFGVRPVGCAALSPGLQALAALIAAARPRSPTCRRNGAPGWRSCCVFAGAS